MIPAAATLSFLDGRPKRLLIGREWVPAASGRTFTGVNPSTGEVIAELAEDTDRAVAAARQAFTSAPWRGMIDVEDGMRVAREEIFGPVACVLPPAGTAAGVTPSSGTRRRP